MYSDEIVRKFLIKAFDYINNLYNGLFDDVKLEVTDEDWRQSGYSYGFNEKTHEIKNPRITICIEDYNEFDDFQTRHYNNEFGLNLEHKYLVVMLRILCHEMSHHINIEDFKDDDDEYYDCLHYIQDVYKSGTEERKRAYRMIPEEYAADQNAAEILRYHLSDLLNLYEEN